MAASYVVFKRTANSKRTAVIQNIVQACSRDYEYYFNFATHSYFGTNFQGRTDYIKTYQDLY